LYPRNSAVERRRIPSSSAAPFRAISGRIMCVDADPPVIWEVWTGWRRERMGRSGVGNLGCGGLNAKTFCVLSDDLSPEYE